jgi:hypothetical protein
MPLKVEGVNNPEMLTSLLTPLNETCREPLEDAFSQQFPKINN